MCVEKAQADIFVCFCVFPSLYIIINEDFTKPDYKQIYSSERKRNRRLACERKGICVCVLGTEKEKQEQIVLCDKET